MADQTVPVVQASVNAASSAITAASLTAANDGTITVTDENMIVVLVDGGAGSTVLFKAGTSGLKYQQGDVSVTLGAGETKAVFVESARAKAVSGADKGKIRLDASANCSAYAVVLP